MSSPDGVRPRAIVAGHGDFAQGLVSAVHQVTGRGDLFIPVSVRGMCPEDIERLLADHADSGARVIFTDLPAGSCTIAARRVLRGHEDVVLVTGVNLAALIDFVFHGELPAPAAAESAAERGRSTITVVGAPRGA